MDIGALVVRLVANSDAYVSGLGKAAGATSSWAAKTSAVGKTLTKFVTMPILAGAAAAGALAYEFEESMSQIDALIGASDKQMQTYEKQIMDVAKITGKVPKEIAESYYFLLSSGLKGKVALDALTASAKASAAGMGAMPPIAQAAAAAVNAYGAKNLSAGRAVDILLAAVREGTGEASDYASAIGAVIPVAETMGVSFGEVAGTMAAMSLNGTNAHEAVTQITAGLSQSIKPTKEGAETLKTIGWSFAKLRDEIDKKGLIDTYNELNGLFDKNVEKMGSVFGNIRSLRGVLTLTGESAKKYEQIIREVEKAQGDTNEAFKTAAEKDGFKLRQSWAKMQVQLIHFGEKILPVFVRIVEHVGKAVDAFSKLGGTTQEFLLIAAGAAGPIARIAGALGKIGGSAGRAATGVGKLPGPLGKLGGATGLFALATAAAIGFKDALDRISKEGGWDQFKDWLFGRENEQKQRFDQTIAQLEKLKSSSLGKIDKALKIDPSTIGSFREVSGALAKLRDTREQIKTLRAAGLLSESEASALLTRVNTLRDQILAAFDQVSGYQIQSPKIVGAEEEARRAKAAMQAVLSGAPLQQVVNIVTGNVANPYPIYTPKPHLGGTFSGPHSGYPAIMHGTETVVSHDHPQRGMRDLAKAGLLGGAGAGAVVHMYGPVFMNGAEAIDEMEAEMAARARSY